MEIPLFYRSVLFIIFEEKVYLRCAYTASDKGELEDGMWSFYMHMGRGAKPFRGSFLKG